MASAALSRALRRRRRCGGALAAVAAAILVRTVGCRLSASFARVLYRFTACLDVLPPRNDAPSAVPASTSAMVSPRESSSSNFSLAACPPSPLARIEGDDDRDGDRGSIVYRRRRVVGRLRGTDVSARGVASVMTILGGAVACASVAAP